MRKITLSLTDETEAKLRNYAKKEYHNMRGSLSIVVERALREFFERMQKEKK